MILSQLRLHINILRSLTYFGIGTFKEVPSVIGFKLRPEFLMATAASLTTYQWSNIDRIQ